MTEMLTKKELQEQLEQALKELEAKDKAEKLPPEEKES